MKRILLLLFAVVVIIMSCKSNVLEPVHGEKLNFFYKIAEGGNVLIEIENRVNEVVRSFELGHLPNGHYQQGWEYTDNNGNPIVEGVYFIYIYVDEEPINSGLTILIAD